MNDTVAPSLAVALVNEVTSESEPVIVSGFLISNAAPFWTAATVAGTSSVTLCR